jgi:hypothetical protein
MSAMPKSEGRNPKGRKKAETRNPKKQADARPFRPSEFGLLSDLGLRVSAFCPQAVDFCNSL